MRQTALKSLLGGSAVLAAGLLLVGAQVVVADTTTTELEYEITEGTKAVDIVDQATGDVVPEPTVQFGEQPFSADSYTVGEAGDVLLGTESEAIRADNPMDSTGEGDELNVSIAPSGEFASAEWSDGSNTYDIDGTNMEDGRLDVRPASAIIEAADEEGTCDINEVTQGTNSDFSTAESIDLLIQDGDPSFCRYDLKEVELEQGIPASQEVGNYSIDMTLTIV